MKLEIKSMKEVLSNLIDWITLRTDALTDFNPGSAIMTLSEAISMQFEEFYFAMKQNVLYAIENAIYDAFDFELKRSKKATGYVTIDFSEPLPSNMNLPRGSIFCTSSKYGYIYFESLEDVLIEQGSVSVMVQVECKTEGEVGNVPANAITTLVTSNSIIKRVYNDIPFTSGSEEETTVERKKRFQHYIRTLSKATRDAILYGCLQVEGVVGAYLDDSYVGYAKLYAHDSEGELSEELRQAIVKNLINYRSAGIEIEVFPITKVYVSLNLKVMVNDDVDLEDAEALMKTSVTKFVNNSVVSTNFYLADVIHLIKSTFENLVINITTLEGSDVSIKLNEIVRLGQLEIQCVHKEDWRS